MIKKIHILFYSSIFLLLTTGCNRDAEDPSKYAPISHYSIWRPLSTNVCASSKYCKPLVSSNFNPDDLSLGELIDLALINNPSTKKSWQEARAAAAIYGEKLSKYYPEIELMGSYIRERQTYMNELQEHPHKATPYYRTTVTPEANISYIIFDFGQRRSSSETARQSLFYADLNHNRQIQTVMQLIMNDYYDYLYQKQELVSRKADLEDAKVSLDAANVKFMAGIASVGDVVQAKTKYLQTKIDVSNQKENVESSFVQLAYDAGLPANFPFKVGSFPEKAYIDEMMANVEDLVKEAYEKRQDYLAMQADLKSKMANIEYTKAQERPLILGTFDIGKNWYNDHDYEDYHFKGMLKLTFPLFRGFFYKNQIRNAKALYQQSKADLEQLELSIISDITNTHFIAQTSAEIFKYSEEYLEAAQERFNIALANYKAGTGTILDVIAAQSSLADARSKKSRAKKDWYTSLANLSYYTGSLCTPPKDIKTQHCCIEEEKDNYEK